MYMHGRPQGEARVSRLPPPLPGKRNLYWRPFCFFFFIWGPLYYVFLNMGGLFYYVRGFLLLFIPGGGLFWVCPPTPYENFCGRPMYMYINAVYILYKVVQYLLHIDKLQYCGERCRV